MLLGFCSEQLILAKVYDGAENFRPVYEDNETIYHTVQKLLALFIIKLTNLLMGCVFDMYIY